MATAWTDSPPLSQPGDYYELCRAKSGTPMKGVCLSDKPWGTHVHWYGGHSFPHQEKDCPACAAKRGSTRYAWVACWNPHTRIIALFEFTPGCERTAEAWIKAHGTLRGTTITIKRGGTKINGPLRLEIEKNEYGINEIPKDIDVRAAMEQIWHPDALIDTHQQSLDEVQRAAAETLELLQAKQDLAELAASQPRFKIEKVFEATPAQLEMLAGHRAAAKAKTNGTMHS